MALQSEFPRRAFYIRAAGHRSGIVKMRNHPHRTFSVSNEFVKNKVYYMGMICHLTLRSLAQSRTI